MNESTVETADVIKAVTGRFPPDAGAPSEDAHERLERELALLTSPQMREIQAIVDRAARADVTVLIKGETGVDKELIARAVHARSLRRRHAFVTVNCAAMPRELLESELFGHERGAVTGGRRRQPGRFELGDGGTIFLDEISELHPALQAKLLHVLQDGEFCRVGGRSNVRVDVRIICATTRDLPREVAANRFREDLFYRLNVINILVPPLRERSEEIAALARYFVRRYSHLFDVPERELGADVLEAFAHYAWPGNIRELEQVIKRMIVLQDWSLPDPLAAAPKAPAATALIEPEPVGATKGPSLKDISRRAVQEVEREVICRALQQCQGNRVKTAKLLRVSYRGLLYKIKNMGLRQGALTS